VQEAPKNKSFSKFVFFCDLPFKPVTKNLQKPCITIFLFALKVLQKDLVLEK